MAVGHASCCSNSSPLGETRIPGAAVMACAGLVTIYV